MEPISIGEARRGGPTASAGSIRIHSAYDPKLEAEKYFDSQQADIATAATIIVIGAGLGYLDEVITTRMPEVRLIAVHLDQILYNNRIRKNDTDIQRWHPGCLESEAGFFRRLIGELDVGGLRIVNWPAAMNARPETAARINEGLAELIRRHSGNISATAAFGRLWIRNTIRNFLNLDYIRTPVPVDAPIVLAASGPSLEPQLEYLSRFRNRFVLWSLPSAVEALSSAGITPDLIFTVDPGFWARLHSRGFPDNVPVARPLSAAPVNHETPAILIPQGMPGEEELLGDGKWPLLALPETGTVAATALETWKRLGRSDLCIAGLDLSWSDLRSHARPHSFDGWLEIRRGRTRPALTDMWERRRQVGSSLQTYADWFASVDKTRRTFRLKAPAEYSVAAVPGMKEVSSTWFEGLPIRTKQKPSAGTIRTPMDSSERRRSVKALLERWKELVRSDPESPVAERLIYTLDPGTALELRRRRGANARSDRYEQRAQVLETLRGLERFIER